MANRWGNKGNSDRLYFGGSNISADDCSQEIKRCLLLVRKAMTKLDSILKSRYIILSTKVHLVNAMIIPVVMYGCESWTIKKAECQRTDALGGPREMLFMFMKRPWCWERLRTRGERDDRGWDDGMASLTQWPWVCANSGRQWRTGKPGALQFMESQRVGCD